MFLSTTLCFLPVLQREITFVTTCLLPKTAKPFQNDSAIKGKNLLQREQMLYFYELTPLGKGGLKDNGRVASPESVTIHLNSARNVDKRIKPNCMFLAFPFSVIFHLKAS